MGWVKICGYGCGKWKYFVRVFLEYFVCCIFFVVFVIDFMCFYGLLKMSIIGLCIKVG